MTRAAIIIVNQKGDTLHGGFVVLWRGLTELEAKRLCSHPDTASTNSFLAYVDDDCLAYKPGLKEPGKWEWHWQKDDGRYDVLLQQLGIRVAVSPEAA